MKISRFLFLGLLLSTAGLPSSCDLVKDGPCITGKGSTTTEERGVKSFTGVDLRIAGRVYISRGNDYTVQVKSYNNLISEIETDVDGNSLVIKSSNCLDFSQESTTVYITMPSVENIELKSSGEIQLHNVPAASSIRLNLSGSGKIKYTGSANKILLLHSGSGDIELNGTAELLEATISGSGKVFGYNMNAHNSRTILSGSGEQQVWVTNSLEVNITGSGNVYYRGIPNSISIYKSGSGDVYARN